MFAYMKMNDAHSIFNTYAETKCPRCCRQFQVHFLNRKCSYFYSNFIEICFHGCNWQQAISISNWTSNWQVMIGSDYGLVPKMWQVFIWIIIVLYWLRSWQTFPWTNNDLIYWRIFAYLGLVELNHSKAFPINKLSNFSFLSRLLMIKHKKLEANWCVISTVYSVGLVSKHQTLGINGTDQVSIVFHLTVGPFTDNQTWFNFNPSMDM